MAMRKIMFGIAFSLFGIAAVAEPITIAALGDSLTQGYGLHQEDGFVPQLQAWLRAHDADVVLINAGVSGDTTAGGASRIAWTLTPDVDGLIVALGGNDLLRGLDPAMSRTNLEEIVKTAAEAGVDTLIVGMQAPGNYGPEYKAAFDVIYPELAASYGTVFSESFFAGISGETSDPAEMRQYMQADGLHPNPDGVKRIVEALGPAVLELVNRVAASQ